MEFSARFAILSTFVFYSLSSVCCLDNGLALTPPKSSGLRALYGPVNANSAVHDELSKTLKKDPGAVAYDNVGWMQWERFRCNIDCDKDPSNCISEKLFMEMADHMVADGYKEAGYEYVSIDDCWSSHNRTADGQLQPDPKRFPNGIPALANYIHSKGLKFGIYADYGTLTCAGYPGSIKHVEQDMKTFANWKVDYLKLDGCYADPTKFDTGYPLVTKALNDTGRPIVFSCSWPAYVVAKGLEPDYQKIAKYCNLWRNYDDIQDSWDSVRNIVDYYAKKQDVLIPAAGPGHWNDPDELIVGDFGLSEQESKSQFANWAIMASPLIISADLRNIAPWAKQILLNKEIIAVNQDKLGIQGRQLQKSNNEEIWSKKLADGSVAVALFSRRTDQPVNIEASFKLVGLQSSKASVRDLYLHKHLGVFENSFIAKVNPSGVVMVKIAPAT